MRAGPEPLFAVVQMYKFESWVLPKGKLARGETAVQAARREVMEETGYEVSVHEFIGTLAYEVGGRPKIVQFWRMQARDDAPAYELMHDVRKVEWLPLDDAVGLLTHLREREFLASVGPHVAAATMAASSPHVMAPDGAEAHTGSTIGRKRWTGTMNAFLSACLRRIRPARARG